MELIIPEEVSSFLLKSNASLEDCLTENFLYKPTKDISIIRRAAKDLFYKDIMPYYNGQNKKVNLLVYNFILEPLKNAHFHSGINKRFNKHNISVDLFLSPYSLVVGFNDGGDYFRGEKVKKYWESQKRIQRQHKVKSKEVGYGIGTPFIYNVADLIHINRDSGTLFLGLSAGGKLFRR